MGKEKRWKEGSNWYIPKADLNRGITNLIKLEPAQEPIHDDPDHFPVNTALPPPEEVSDESDDEIATPTPSIPRPSSSNEGLLRLTLPNEGLSPRRLRPWEARPNETTEQRAKRKAVCKDIRRAKKKQRISGGYIPVT